MSQQQQLTCLQQACSLQQLERDYASRPHGYNARHHDAHALHSSQRAWLDTAQRSWRVTTAAVDLFTASLLCTAARTRPCIATTRLECATSCCACTAFIAARTCKHCLTKANACRRWCTPETGPQTRGHMHRAPHHSACEHCAGRAVQRPCGKCNRSARSLPGAAGPVRPAANTATATVHTTLHAPDQIQCALSEVV